MKIALCLTVAGALCAGCLPEPEANLVRVDDLTPIKASTSSSDDHPSIPGPPPPPATLSGEFEQGGFVKGIAPFDTVSATVNGNPLGFDPEDRTFFVGLDRDAGERLELVFTARDGQKRTQLLEVKPRAWNIQHVNVAKRSGGTSEAWWKKREPDWLAIKASREKKTGATGWRQDFIWPVKGRISGRFGSQRIYRGEPGSYHSGLDIAPGAGTPFVAPADGVVVLAARNYSLEGNLLIIDHGQGLNSAFLHASRLMVSEGDEVKQGQHIGNVGSSGRATGPHLHWSIKWQDARLDPLLFLPPQ